VIVYTILCVLAIVKKCVAASPEDCPGPPLSRLRRLVAVPTRDSRQTVGSAPLRERATAAGMERDRSLAEPEPGDEADRTRQRRRRTDHGGACPMEDGAARGVFRQSRCR